jgi:hypothetical protein
MGKVYALELESYSPLEEWNIVERGFPQLKRGTSMSLFQLVNLFHGS